jgi:hypothetical protein
VSAAAGGALSNGGAIMTKKRKNPMSKPDPTKTAITNEEFAAITHDLTGLKGITIQVRFPALDDSMSPTIVRGARLTVRPLRIIHKSWEDGEIYVLVPRGARHWLIRRASRVRADRLKLWCDNHKKHPDPTEVEIASIRMIARVIEIKEPLPTSTRKRRRESN